MKMDGTSALWVILFLNSAGIIKIWRYDRKHAAKKSPLEGICQNLQ